MASPFRAGRDGGVLGLGGRRPLPVIKTRRLRAIVKGLLGTRNERLVQFLVAPVRSRTRVGKPAPTPPPVESRL
jgi:hypothetical protein